MTVDSNGNACVFKMVSRCYYQDTNRQMNYQLCSNCILARIEKHLFSIANDNHNRSGKAAVKKVVGELPNELRTGNPLRGAGI